MTASRAPILLPLLVAAACSSSVPPPQAQAWSAARTRFGQLEVSQSDVSGKIWIDSQPISVHTRLDDKGTLIARYSDGNGNRVVGYVRADGKRGVQVNGQYVAVDPSGSVRADAFTGLSPALRAALGLVPLETGCRTGESASHAQDALALPYNLLRRAEPDALPPETLVPAVSCSREAVHFRKGASATDDVVEPERLLARSHIAAKAGAL